MRIQFVLGVLLAGYCPALLAQEISSQAQNTSGIQLNPGERLIAVDGVPVGGGRVSAGYASGGGCGAGGCGGTTNVYSSPASYSNYSSGAGCGSYGCGSPSGCGSSVQYGGQHYGSPVQYGGQQGCVGGGCGSAAPAQGYSVPGRSVSYSSGGAQGHAVQQASYTGNIVGTLTASGLPFSHSNGNSALDKANTERLRNGQRPLLPDPQLQQLALQKATMAAQRGYKNHVGGTLGGAKCEGVGHTNGRFLSCCLDEPGTYGGAAMVRGADGWYCCLLVR